jgi:hypothetical protein
MPCQTQLLLLLFVTSPSPLPILTVVPLIRYQRYDGEYREGMGRDNGGSPA